MPSHALTTECILPNRVPAECRRAKFKSPLLKKIYLLLVGEKRPNEIDSEFANYYRTEKRKCSDAITHKQTVIDFSRYSIFSL